MEGRSGGQAVHASESRRGGRCDHSAPVSGGRCRGAVPVEREAESRAQVACVGMEVCIGVSVRP